MLDKKLYEDSLREMTSIGGGHAAARLSKMIDKKVKIQLPRVWFGKVEESYFLGEKKVIEISNNFGVVKRGLAVQMMSQPTATNLLQLFLKEKIEEFGELEKSALLELSNILAGAMVSAIADLIEEVMSMEVPKITIDFPLSVIKRAINRQREVLGWTYFSTVNIYVEEEKISLQLSLFPFFDLMKDMWKIK
jgi:chemotaxis protein CheC